jgi:hypothetical protein
MSNINSKIVNIAQEAVPAALEVKDVGLDVSATLFTRLHVL